MRPWEYSKYYSKYFRQLFIKQFIHKIIYLQFSHLEKSDIINWIFILQKHYARKWIKLCMTKMNHLNFTYYFAAFFFLKKDSWRELSFIYTKHTAILYIKEWLQEKRSHNFSSECIVTQIYCEWICVITGVD